MIHLTYFLILTFSTFLNTSPSTLDSSMSDLKTQTNHQTITVLDSIQIAFYQEGQGDETLLFLHGLGSNHKAWKKNISFLKNHYNCITVDLPGYGNSSKGDYPFTMSFFADALQEFIQKLELKNVVLVGHSMGGQIAIHLALNHPSLCERLILIAPAGFETFSEKEKQWFSNFFTPQFIKSTPEEQIIKNFHFNFYSFPKDAQFMIDDRMTMRATPAYEHYTKMIPKCVNGMLQEPIFDHLTSLNIPTLIIYGQEDNLIPSKILHPNLTTPQIANAGNELIQDSRLKLIQEAGHFVQWEKSEKVNTIIQNFLQ